jgi:hypothetical protein
VIPLPRSLDMHVQGHLAAEDAMRQQRTAAAILRRYERQPGVILGDEVGMGKTFVALAVASAHVLHDPSRPVVVMVPKPVLQKWKRDADTFRAACLRDDAERALFRVRTADSAVELFKLLDDPSDRRATLIVLSHGAMQRKMNDPWVKLAVLKASIKGRHGIDNLRHRLARFAPMLLGQAGEPDRHYELYLRLLSADVEAWRLLLVRDGWLDEEDDDPVPRLFAESLESFDLTEVFQNVVSVLPERTSAGIRDRIREARVYLGASKDSVLPSVWRWALSSMKLDLPLLVLDEAHRAKNAHTRLASLLAEEKKDLDEAGGLFADAFDRMLFLTATPFQLGHGELCNILSRFSAVRWTGEHAPTIGKEGFQAAVDELKRNLDAMQLATDWMERSWKNMLPADVAEARRDWGESWWTVPDEVAGTDCSGIANDRIRAVVLAWRQAHARIRMAEASLRPWVLRHTKSRFLPALANSGALPRRVRIEGAEVLSEVNGRHEPASGGLRIDGPSALPYFLAARLATFDAKEKVFGDGIASSFEALLNTRQESEPPGGNDAGQSGDRGSWYVARLREAARTQEIRGYATHPKLAATVDLAMALWRNGHKVLIFNEYIATGAALHRALSERMQQEIERLAMDRFACAADEVEARIEAASRRWDRGEARAAVVEKELNAMMAGHPRLFETASSSGDLDDPEVSLMSETEVRDALVSIMLRFLRTPSFFLRYAPRDETFEHDHEGFVRACFDQQGAMDFSLRDVIRQFLAFLESRPSATGRQDYLRALLRVQTGTHAGSEVDSAFEDDPSAGSGRVRLAPNVRRVYGDTRDETRQRLMLTFNTPFYPEILIASSVMEESVDLHLNCRHIIHHDLDWNPSSLEQRIGRIDRLGAKAEQCGQPIRVYIPYLEGCQDEKRFRVVIERERWFGVVMGAEESMTRILSATAWERERMAEQPLVPDTLVRELSMSLGIDGVDQAHEPA